MEALSGGVKNGVLEGSFPVFQSSRGSGNYPAVYLAVFGGAALALALRRRERSLRGEA